MDENKLKKYMKRAEVVAENSHDEETQVGAVLINNNTLSVISEGYNGFVRGAPDQDLPRTRPDKYPYMIHAEQNLLANACRNGISTDNSFIVLTLSPCAHCVRMCWQAGIKEIYFKDIYRDFHQSKDMGDLEIDFTNYGIYYRILLSPKKR